MLINKIKAFFIKPHTKAWVLALFTIAIGIISNFAVNSRSLWPFWPLLVLVSIIYLCVLYKYAKLENSQNDTVNALNSKAAKLENENHQLHNSLRTFHGAMQGIGAICKMCARQTNLKIHEIIEEGKIYCDNWNFDMASSLLCAEIYNHIITNITVCGEYDSIADVEVLYVKLVENKKSRSKNSTPLINLCAFYHPSRQSPSLYRQNREINKKDSSGKLYHDAKLFKEHTNSTSILLTRDDIQRDFGFLKFDNDYNQYIGIPVFCETADNKSRMIGLLEIVCHGSCLLSTEPETIKQYIDYYLSSYASLFLMLYKNDKALRATPKEKPKYVERKGEKDGTQSKE